VDIQLTCVSLLNNTAAFQEHGAFVANYAERMAFKLVVDSFLCLTSSVTGVTAQQMRSMLRLLIRYLSNTTFKTYAMHWKAIQKDNDNSSSFRQALQAKSKSRAPTALGQSHATQPMGAERAVPSAAEASVREDRMGEEPEIDAELASAILACVADHVDLECRAEGSASLIPPIQELAAEAEVQAIGSDASEHEGIFRNAANSMLYVLREFFATDAGTDDLLTQAASPLKQARYAGMSDVASNLERHFGGETMPPGRR
jgi:hypothetical protein